MKLEFRSMIGGGLTAAAQAVVAGLVARFGATSRLPMHFDAAGRVDRWGDRQQVAGTIVVLAAFTVLSTLAFAVARRRTPEATRGLAVAEALMLLVTSLLVGLMTAIGFGQVHNDGGAQRIGMTLLWVILGAVGAFLGKTAPNPLVGVRTPWTRASRLSWDKSNRLAGRLFFWGGIAGVSVAPFAPQPLGMRASLTAALIIAGLSVAESWRVWRSDPHRRPILGG